MLKIKLTRLGKKKEPRYRIVVNERRDKRDGSYVVALGYYQPTAQPKVLQLDVAAYEQWLSRGAQPTEVVAYLYEIAKAGKGFPEKKKSLSKKAKAKLAAQEQADREAKSATQEQSEEQKVAPQEEQTPPPQEKVIATGETAVGDADPAVKE